MENWKNDKEKTGIRDAKEVFIFMHRNFRASRNIRAHWFFHHLEKPIHIESSGLETDNEYSQEMSIVGIVPKDGDGSEEVGNEEFLVTGNTKVTYISRYYRHVFVLDLSPSTIVADYDSNNCLCTRIMMTLKNAMRSCVKPFVIPGTKNIFNPQIYISVCVFTPFLKFEQYDSTLIQGVLLTDSNVEKVLDIVEKKFNEFFKCLFEFSKPILNDWGRLRRRYKNYKFESFCDPSSTCDTTSNLKTSDLASLKMKRKVRTKNKKVIKPQKLIVEKNDQNGQVEIMSRMTSLMKPKRGHWKIQQNQAPEENVTPFSGYKGYVLPEWSLVFMLRLGLIATQMLPENTQSNVIVITDSVCGMPDANALQQVLTQLRSFTIACSFIQLQKKTCSEPVFGHVASCELFYFLAMATFGTFLPKNRMCTTSSVDDSSDEEGYDEIIESSGENINLFHRALICWSFQNAIDESDFMTKTFSNINPEFINLQKRGIERHRRFLTTYTSTLNQLMYVRLREGFTLKAARFLNNGKTIEIMLCLAFRPLVFIEYIITSPWPTLKNQRNEVQVEVIIQAPYHELKDLLKEGQYLDPDRLNMTKSAIDGILEADRLLLHIHSFSTQQAFYTIPSGVTIDYALFSSYDKTARKLPRVCIGRSDENSTKSFISFWRIILDLNDATWQKWVHTHTERVLLTVPHVEFDLFNARKVPVFNTKEPMNRLHNLIKSDSSFCLISSHTYVTMIFDKCDAKQPSFFFMRRIYDEAPVVIIKTAFLGGLSSTIRRKLIDIHRNKFLDLRFTNYDESSENESESESGKKEKETQARARCDTDKENVLSVIRRPLERMLVKYNDIPADLQSIVRVQEATSNENEIKLITMHNAISKCLSCRRIIIIMSSYDKEGGAYLARNITDYIANVLIQKRVLDEKFKPAWAFNNIVSMCRQIYNSSGTSLEQYVVFPATTIVGNEKNPIMKRVTATTGRNPTTPNEMPSKLSCRPLALISEMWFEPAAAEMLENRINMQKIKTVEERLNEDIRLISTLYTFDRILRMCGTCVDPTLAQNGFYYEKWDKDLMWENETNFDEYSERCRLVKIQDYKKSRLMNWSENGVETNKVSPFVNIYSSPFSLPTLIKTAPRKMTKVVHFVRQGQSISKCNKLLVLAIHQQLEEIFDVSWLLSENENEKILEDLFESTFDPNIVRLRVFVRGISTWTMGMVFVPDIKCKTDFVAENSIPLVTVYLNESQLAYCAAKGAYNEKGLVDAIPHEIPDDYISNVRFGWRPHNPSVVPITVDSFQGFLTYIEEDLMGRAKMTAMFDAAKRGLEVDEEKVCEMAIDVDFFEFEMETVPKTLKTLCRHLRNDLTETPEPEKLCSQESNIGPLFWKALNQNFALVPGTKNIFYVRDSSTRSKRKKRKTAAIAAAVASATVIDGEGDSVEGVNEDINAEIKVDELLEAEINRQNKIQLQMNQTIPCFIQLNCSVIFPDGTMDTFPIDFLPSCIYEVLDRSQYVPKEKIDPKSIEIGLELLIMTNKEQTLDKSYRGIQTDEFENDFRNRGFKNPVDEYRQTIEMRIRSRHIRDDYEFNDDDEAGGKNFLLGLAKREKKMVCDLLQSVNVILELEKILVETRNEKISTLKLKEVTDYIQKGSESTGRIGHIERREKPLSLAIRTAKAKEMFLKSLSGIKFEYLKLKQHKKTKFFYCCRVYDIDAYQKFRLKHEKPETSQSSESTGNEMPEKSEPEMFGQDRLSDFWIILSIDQNITLYFCQRYEKQHTYALDVLWKTVRQKLRIVNQQLLLERMFQTRECDSLLIAPEPPLMLDALSELIESSKRRIRMDSASTLIQTDSAPPPIDDGMRFDFAPGYFACSLQKELWFQVPQRLRDMSQVQKKPALALAFSKLRIALQEFEVKNVPNTYIFKDSKTDQFVYMQIHMTKDSYEQSIKNTRIPLKKKHLLEVEDRLKTDIAMTFFSIDPPDDYVYEQFSGVMIARLRVTLLTELLRTFEQNRDQMLFSNEVYFLQDIDNPYGRSFFSIPLIFGNYLSALFYYINQHVKALPCFTLARVKDEMSGSRSTSFSSATFMTNNLSTGSFRQFRFIPQSPIVGVIPPEYEYSSFFLYLRPPIAGVTSVGMGVVEFRIVSPEGYVSDGFDQPRMNEQSHEQLVPNVPTEDDKAVVYRDIIKVQKFETPKEADKSICGYLEVIVWRQGEFEMKDIDEIVHELIEMSMYDVITEFGYLNTHMFEPNPTNTYFRHSEVFQENTIVTYDPNFFIPSNPMTSTCSIDGKHGWGGSVDVGSTVSTGPKTVLSRLSLIAKEFESTSKNNFSAKRSEYINRKTAYGIIKWLDFVASKHGETNSVIKETIRFECQHAILTPLFEIRNRIEIELGGPISSDVFENVVLCGLKKTDSESYSSSVRESNLSIYGGCAEWRFEVLTTDPFVEMKADIGVDEAKGNSNEYLIVSYIKNVFLDLGDNTILTEEKVKELTTSFRNNLHGKYEPLIEKHAFSPRQRVMFALMKGEVMTIYYYNFHPNIQKAVQNKIQKIAAWHNAKAKLLREIGLHKIGITHMSSIETKPKNEFDYERLIWRDPAQLIAKEYPPESLNVPAYMDTPEYTNIFYRMYRQPNLQYMMGRASLIYKCACVPTNHFEQMLRWRDFLKKRLALMRKITTIHDEMLKGKTEMKEEQFLAFLRPRIEKKLMMTPNGEEDERTGGNDGCCSITERTSKRPSQGGDMSVRSVVIPDSDIFKNKGTFVLKKENKRSPVAKLIDEIRYPMEVLECWRRKKKAEEEKKITAENAKKEIEENRKFEEIKGEAEFEKSDENGRKKEVEINVEEKPMSILSSILNKSKTTEESQQLLPTTAASEGSSRQGSSSAPPPQPTSSSMSSLSSSQSISSGPFSRAKALTISAANRLVRPFRKLSTREPKEVESTLTLPSPDQIETGEDPLDTLLEIDECGPEEGIIEEEVNYEPSIIDIIYTHAEDLCKYLAVTIGYKILKITHISRKSTNLNRYNIVPKEDCDENPYIILYKIFDAGIVFLELSYELPDVVIKVYLYERSKFSTADFYMRKEMKKLYTKENERMNNEAISLMTNIDFATFHYDFHLRAVIRHVEALTSGQKSIFGNKMNILQLLNLTMNVLRKKTIRTMNIIDKNRYRCDKAINDEFWEKYRDPDKSQCRMFRMKVLDYEWGEEEHNEEKTVYQYMLGEIDETKVMESGKNVKICHLITCKDKNEKFDPEKMPYFTLMVYMDSDVLKPTESNEIERKETIDEEELNSEVTEDEEIIHMPNIKQGKWWKKRLNKWSFKTKKEKWKKMKWKKREMKKRGGRVSTSPVPVNSENEEEGDGEGENEEEKDETIAQHRFNMIADYLDDLDIENGEDAMEWNQMTMMDVRREFGVEIDDSDDDIEKNEEIEWGEAPMVRRNMEPIEDSEEEGEIAQKVLNEPGRSRNADSISSDTTTIRPESEFYDSDSDIVKAYYQTIMSSDEDVKRPTKVKSLPKIYDLKMDWKDHLKEMINEYKGVKLDKSHPEYQRCMLMQKMGKIFEKEWRNYKRTLKIKKQAAVREAESCFDLDEDKMEKIPKRRTFNEDEKANELGVLRKSIEKFRREMELNEGIEVEKQQYPSIDFEKELFEREMQWEILAAFREMKIEAMKEKRREKKQIIKEFLATDDWKEIWKREKEFKASEPIDVVKQYGSDDERTHEDPPPSIEEGYMPFQIPMTKWGRQYLLRPDIPKPTDSKKRRILQTFKCKRFARAEKKGKIRWEWMVVRDPEYWKSENEEKKKRREQRRERREQRSLKRVQSHWANMKRIQRMPLEKLKRDIKNEILVNVCGIEPILEFLLKDIKSYRLCNFMLIRYGENRCSFHENSDKSDRLFMMRLPKYHCLVFLIDCYEINQPKVFITNKDKTASGALIQEAVREFTMALSAFIWTDTVFCPIDFSRTENYVPRNLRGELPKDRLDKFIKRLYKDWEKIMKI